MLTIEVRSKQYLDRIDRAMAAASQHIDTVALVNRSVGWKTIVVVSGWVALLCGVVAVLARQTA